METTTNNEPADATLTCLETGVETELVGFLTQWEDGTVKVVPVKGKYSADVGSDVELTATLFSGVTITHTLVFAGRHQGLTFMSTSPLTKSN